MKELINTNWRTTYSGLSMVIIAIVHLVFAIINHKAMDENLWITHLLAIMGGLGLVFARDAQASNAYIAKTNGKLEALQNDVAQVKGDTSKLSKPNVPNPT